MKTNFAVRLTNYEVFVVLCISCLRCASEYLLGGIAGHKKRGKQYQIIQICVCVTHSALSRDANLALY